MFEPRFTLPRAVSTEFKTLVLALAWCVLAPSHGSQNAAPLDQALGQQQALHRAGVNSQKRIDKLDDETRRMLAEYQAARQELENLERYNRQMERLVRSQETRIDDLESQIQELEVTRRDLLPLMLEMVETLERFVAADTPFLPAERSMRLRQLSQLLDDPDPGLGEKYRRILEAYGIEADYAYGIEAYTGELALESGRQTVDFLRLGRTALYWLSLDRSRAGVWDPRSDHWQELPQEYHADIERALRVARKQAPPELLRLPMRTLEATP